jgi:hypothetical protein
MCCRVISIGQSLEDALKEHGECDDPKCEGCFLRQIWKPITFEDAAQINPWWAAGKNPEADWFIYTCTALTDEGLCPYHGDDKIRTCSEYPWYGEEPPADFSFSSADCGYKD